LTKNGSPGKREEPRWVVGGGMKGEGSKIVWHARGGHTVQRRREPDLELPKKKGGFGSRKMGR